MDPLSGAVIAIMCVSGAVAAVIIGMRADKFHKELQLDPDVQPIPGVAQACRSRREPVVVLMPENNNSDTRFNEQRWLATSQAPRFAARTSLSLVAPESRGWVGASPPSVVDEQKFWTSHQIQASDEAGARGVLAHPDVSLAVRTLFADAFQLDIARDGNVRVMFPRRMDATAFDAKLYVMRVQRVVEMLEAHASAPAVAANSLRADSFSSGGASGAPVGVPIGPR